MESRNNEISSDELDNIKIDLNIDKNGKAPIEIIDEVVAYLRTTVQVNITSMQSAVINELDLLDRCREDINKLSDNFLSLELKTGEELKSLIKTFYIVDEEKMEDFDRIFDKLDKLNQANKLISKFLSDCENTKNAYLEAKSRVNNINKLKLTAMPFLFVKNPKQSIKAIKFIHKLYKNRSKDKKEMINHSESITEIIDQLKEIISPKPFVEMNDQHYVRKTRSKTL